MPRTPSNSPGTDPSQGLDNGVGVVFLYIIMSFNITSINSNLITPS